MSPARTPAVPGASTPAGLATVAEVLGANIRRLRLLRDWRQVDLTHALGQLGASWIRQTLSYVESGQRNITVTELVCVALALDVSLDELLDPLGQTMALRGTWEWLTLSDDEVAAVLLSARRRQRAT
jgi:transcriptional regulator with XRE-family HTH domain